MTRGPIAYRRTTLASKDAEALLFPITAFLRAGGLNKKDAEAVFSSVYAKLLRTYRTRRIDHIGYAPLYADIVTRWTRDRRFVDAEGRPRILSLRGRNGFSTLVREISPQSNPKHVLSILIRYGTVQRLKSDRYELVIPFFFTTAQERIAFEPAAYFLSDASSTLGQLIRRTGRSMSPALFWRKVENTNLSDKAAKKFISYIRERSLIFLEEIDDWLEAHSRKPKEQTNSQRRCRVGLGLFSFSDSKGWKSRQ